MAPGQLLAEIEATGAFQPHVEEHHVGFEADAANRSASAGSVVAPRIATRSRSEASIETRPSRTTWWSSTSRRRTGRAVPGGFGGGGFDRLFHLGILPLFGSPRTSPGGVPRRGDAIGAVPPVPSDRMPDKQMAIQRAWRRGTDTERPIMVAIAGDSASGKTTLTQGLVEALGSDRITAICVDDYHRYDRVERKGLPFTPLHPACNYVDVMEQHLQLLALGQPVLKPVYNHGTGTLDRPVLVEPSEFVIAEGLLPVAHPAVPGVLRRDRLPRPARR